MNQDRIALVSGGGDRHRPTGVALLATHDLPGGRIYLCDSNNDTVDVLDGLGCPLFSFGGHGNGDGQFDTPVDVAIMTLDGSPIGSATDAVLAVAERGNHRVQIFELDGAWLGTIEDGPRKGLRLPSRLDAHARQLQITSSTGAVARIDVASALLPQLWPNTHADTAYGVAA
jgi:hypothetical protein